MLRIAHVSDLHVLSPAGFEWRRVLIGKRLTGLVNLLWQRGRVYRQEYLRAVLEAAASQADHVVVTGDITNLSLEGEYEEARRLLEDLRLSAEVTVIPGNHDIYLPATLHERRFPHHFADLMQSDLPELALDLPAGRYPFVKLRGPAAIIGLSSAVPRPPFVSAGYLGEDQLQALHRVLEHPEVAARTPVILVHHSPQDSRLRAEQLMGGLVDAAALRSALQPLPRGLLLYGHLHVREHLRLPTAQGFIDAVTPSGAALDHPSEVVRAGFNLYRIEDDGSIGIDVQVLDPETFAFQRLDLVPIASPA